MKLSEIIEKYGDDDVEVQILDQCVSQMRRSKKGVSTISFQSEETFDMNGLTRKGIVIWLDRKRLADVIEQGSTADEP